MLNIVTSEQKLTVVKQLVNHLVNLQKLYQLFKLQICNTQLRGALN